MNNKIHVLQANMASLNIEVKDLVKKGMDFDFPETTCWDDDFFSQLSLNIEKQVKIIRKLKSLIVNPTKKCGPD